MTQEFIREAEANAGDSLSDRREDLLIAVALNEFSVHYEQADPKLAEHAWQLAADRLVDHDIKPAETVDALEIG